MNSISFIPSLIKGIENILATEKKYGTTIKKQNYEQHSKIK
jgi:hypothetical protein